MPTRKLKHLANQELFRVTKKLLESLFLGKYRFTIQHRNAEMGDLTLSLVTSFLTMTNSCPRLALFWFCRIGQ